MRENIRKFRFLTRFLQTGPDLLARPRRAEAEALEWDANMGRPRTYP